MKSKRFLFGIIIPVCIFLIVAAAVVGCSKKEPMTPTGEIPFTELYMDEIEWGQRIGEYAGLDKIVEFQTTAANVALATELGWVPGSNVGIGSSLTFDSSVTQFPFCFRLVAVDPGSGMTFDDREGIDLHYAAPAGFRERAISIGDTDDRENDDFLIGITCCDPAYRVIAIGIEVIDNVPEDGEYISVHFADSTKDTVFNESPDCAGTGVFMGIISNQEPLVLYFEENASGDDIFVRDFYFAVVRK